MKKETKISDIDELLQEELADPEFQKAWDETELEDQIRRMIIAARIENHLSQKDLSAQSGIRQSNISRIERGSSIPTLATLNALAKGIGKRLKIEFV